MNRKDRIYAYMQDSSYKPLTAPELAVMLSVPKSDTDELILILDELETEGKIIKNKRGRYKATKNSALIPGKFTAKKNGGGFVVPTDNDNADDEIYIYYTNTAGALDGDSVLVNITRPKTADKRREGEIVKILVHQMKEIIGAYKKTEYGVQIIPDDASVNVPVILCGIKNKNLSDGDKIVAKIVSYPDANQPMKAEFRELIAKKDDMHADTMSIVRRYGLRHEFSEECIKYAQSYAQSVSEEEIKDRRDLRGLDIITIDGEDAKDLDDAVYCEKTKDGLYRLIVSIADVSHYVEKNSPVDEEAYLRATSVYFPDMVIPMLPRELSNGICSLNEKEDRLTLSVIMDIDSGGNVQRYEICKSAIRSKHRMTYTVATALLEGNCPDELKEEYKDIYSELLIMDELADILRSRRENRGSIDFEFPEPKIILDDKGHIAEIKAYEIGKSNHIIEEFMLITNETVAKYACDKNLPFIYRVHETPNEEKTMQLSLFLNAFNLPPITDVTPKTIQILVNSIKETPESSAVNTMILRTMMKARYHSENLGHFGLAAKYYCHFTSPIRRYPDLVIHRILKQAICGKLNDQEKLNLTAFTIKASEQSSECEVMATDAERDCDKQKICMYMADFIGEEFDAIICSVTDFGFFVALENTAEGLVSMRDLDDDYYVFDQAHYRLVGERTKKIYSLGDTIRVKLVRSDPRALVLDFIPTDLQARKRGISRGMKIVNQKRNEKKKSKRKTASFVRKKSRR